jgi:integrase
MSGALQRRRAVPGRNSNWRARVFAPAVSKRQEADKSLPSITPHDLRHTAESPAISAGANV